MGRRIAVRSSPGVGSSAGSGTATIQHRIIMQPVKAVGREDVRTPLLVDAHAHVHACFDLCDFVGSACDNFEAAKTALQLPAVSEGCLILMESNGSRAFAALGERAATGKNIGPWQFVPTDEEDSLALATSGRGTLFLVAGQQMATREGVEVLALACDREIPDGMALRDTIEQIHALEAIPVLPWGFGKWWFRRYKIVRDLLQVAEPGSVFIGDSAGRLGWAPRSRIFALASSRGILNLPGTDPLPFPNQAKKPGRFGFVLEGRFEHRRPAAGIRDLLCNLVEQPSTYGRGDSLPTVLRSQVAMHFGRRGAVESWR